jgi:flagellar basal-body rod modification protein FlgD
MDLLSAEMANQDPLQPMDPTQTMTQLAQFSTLQQTNLIAQNQSLATASNLIGATVMIPGQNGAAATTGVVTGVDSSQVATGGVPSLVVSGASAEYPLSAVSTISVPSASATPSTATGTTTGTTAGTTSASSTSTSPTSSN